MIRAATDWPLVFVATAGGAAASIHIGKAAAALPLVQDELSASFAQISVYLAVISLSAALTGVVMGRAASAVGVVRAGIGGLVMLGLASLAGAGANGPISLLQARIVEAVGLSLVVTTMPAIVQAATTAADRSIALGLWAAWLPIGVASSMAGAFFLLGETGWRGLYILCGAVSLCAATLLYLRTRHDDPVSKGAKALPDRLPGFAQPLFRMAFVFCMFSAANMVFMGFLPSVIQTTMVAGTGMATGIGFIAALLLLPTNIGTGAAVGRGVSRHALMVLSFLGIALGGAVFFAPGLPDALRIVAAMIFALSTGITPALVWSAGPEMARDAGIAPPLAAGLFYQAAGIGQVAGPIVAGFMVESLGSWSAAALVVALCSACALAVATSSRRSVGFT